jgi:hypothetical protein
MAKTKFFRVFTEGNATDGRVIEGQWIKDIADTYNPALYGARIWLEHIRGIGPDSTFKAFGDVLAVKAEKVENGKLALFAQLDPTPDLVALIKARQKIYTSVEIDNDFAKTGKTYLVGLAVTDSPASLGTEMLNFAAQAPTNPLAARKQSPGNLFTAATETTLEIEDTPEMTTKTDPVDQAGLLDQFKGLFTTKPDTPPAKPTADTTASAILEIAQQVAGFSTKLDTAATATADQVKSITDKLTESTTAFTALKEAHDKLQTDFTALQVQLDATPGAGSSRPPATGGKGDGNPAKPEFL